LGLSNGATKKQSLRKTFNPNQTYPAMVNLPESEAFPLLLTNETHFVRPHFPKARIKLALVSVHPSRFWLPVT